MGYTSSRSILSHWGPSLLTLGLLGPLGAACGTLEPGNDSPDQDRTALQRRSLEQVFTAQGGKPPAPDAAESAAAWERAESLPQEEVDELKQLLSAADLRVLAMRDSDGDGIHDYRIGQTHGKFLEGDLDLDGDGVRNTLDVAPYDPELGGWDEDGDGAPDQGFADRDSDLVPDHVDWSGTSSDEAAGLQEELFADHGILLVSRSAPFSPTLARSTHDALTRVFRKPLAQEDMPVLRLIATDETCLLVPEEDSEINAVVVPQTQSLLVYRVGLDYAPIVQLGLMVHELGHVWQFSLDSTDDLAAENTQVNFASLNFVEMVEPFGWTTKQQDYDPATDDYTVFTPQDYALGPLHWYLEETPEEWADYLAAIADEVGEDYLEDERLAGIVGDYSLSNPFEWHSDNLLAYVFWTLEEHVNATLSEEEAATLNAAFTQVAREAWPAFRYQNFEHDLVGDHFAEHFPLTDADLDYFTEHYLRPLAE